MSSGLRFRHSTVGKLPTAMFYDADGEHCVIQESSAATEPMIRLGRVLVNVPPRMHLTRSQADDLWPALRRFADTGELSDLAKPRRGAGR